VQPGTALALEAQRIAYSQVGSVGNPLALLLQGRPLGSAGGPGFGWRDLTVYKLGLQQRLSREWVVRAGFSHATQPVPADQTFFNILAPGVVQKHWSLGATWQTPWGGELTGAWTYVPATQVQGAGSIPPGNPPGGFGGGNANIRLKENIVGISYGWKL
jgi:long-chain fatty acid transport protein